MKLLRTKLILYIAVTSSLAASIGLAGGFYSTRKDLYRQMGMRASALADEIGYAFEVLVNEDDLFPIQRIVEQTATIDDVSVIAVVDREGRILAHNDKRLVGQILDEPFIAQALEEETRVEEFNATRFVIADNLHGKTYNPQYHSDVIGVVWVEMDLTPLNTRLRQQYYFMTFAAVVIVGLASGVALFVIQRLIIRRLQYVQGGMRRVENGDLGYRLATDMGRGAEDAISSLVTHFDHMTVSLQKTLDQLSASEASYRDLFEHNRDAQIVTDAAGRCLDANSAALNLTGYILDELIGMPMGRLSLREKRAENAEVLRPLIDIGGGMTEIMICDKNGRHIPVEITISAVTHKGKAAFLGSMRDVTERAYLEQMKSDFINRASHELRTPITKSLLMVDLIEEGGSKSEDQECWRILRAELERQRRLIENLLSVGHLESAQFQLRPVSLDIVPVLKGAIAGIAPIAKIKKIILSQEIASDLPQINGDSNCLQQVFVNLLDNAMKFTPSGGEVHIQAKRNSGGVSVQICNNGNIIPAEDIPYIFDRFFRSSNATQNNIPGSGLGLFVVKSIVEELGGRVTVESTLDTGTTFDVWLPVWEEESDQG